MNRHIKYTAALMILALSISGCGQAASENTTSAQTTAPSTVETNQTISPKVEDLLKESHTVSEYGVFLKENLPELSEQDQMLVLNQLFLAQSLEGQKMYQRIWEGDYLKALNETMGGILDPEKLSDIENTSIQNDFRNIYEGYMTIVRNGEYPDFVPDFNRLNALGLDVSVPLQSLIDIQDQIQQGKLIDDNALNYGRIADFLSTVEENLPKSQGFVRSELKDLYKSLISTAFIGYEGSALSAYIDGDKNTIEAWTMLANEHSKYGFGKLAEELVTSSSKDFVVLIDLINNYSVAAPDTKMIIASKELEESNYAVDYFTVEGLEDADIQLAVNQAVLESSMSLVDAEAKINRIDAGIQFLNQHYLSLSLYNIAYDENDDYMSYEKYITIDLKTGALLTFDDLMQATFESYADRLNALEKMKANKVTVTETPDFYMTPQGLALMGLASGSEDKYFVSLDLYELQGLMDIEKLY